MLPTANGCSHMTCAHNDVAAAAVTYLTILGAAAVMCLNLQNWLKSCTAHNTATLGFYVLDARYIYSGSRPAQSMCLSFTQILTVYIITVS